MVNRYCRKSCSELNESCIFCARKIRFEKILNNHPQPFYIVVYGISRHYGGPEEGEWWYDIQRVQDVKKIWTIKQALVSIRNFKEEYPTQKYNRFSVLGNGEDIEIDIIPTLDLLWKN